MCSDIERLQAGVDGLERTVRSAAVAVGDRERTNLVKVCSMKSCRGCARRACEATSSSTCDNFRRSGALLAAHIFRPIAGFTGVSAFVLAAACRLTVL